MWKFPKTRALNVDFKWRSTKARGLLGALVIRIIVYWDPSWGPWFIETPKSNIKGSHKP